MQNNLKTRLLISETDGSLKIEIPPARFNNYMTIVFIVIDILLLLSLSLMGYGFYHSNLVYKTGLIIFSIPWLSASGINIFLIQLLINKTSIEVNQREMLIYSQKILTENIMTTLLVDDVINRKIVKIPKNSVKNSVFSKLIIELEREEYSLNKFTSYLFNNDEIILLADKINKYINKPVIEKFSTE